MDAKTIGDIIAIATPTITLIITTLAILNSRIGKTTAPLDTPFLKILSIKRHPISSLEFFKLKQNLLILISVIFFINLLNIGFFIFLSIKYSVSILNNSIYFQVLTIIYATSFIAFTYYIFKRTCSFKSLYLDPYNIFSNIDILIEADFQYLFDKCINALKDMNLKISEVELGSSKGEIKALLFKQINIFSKFRAIHVVVRKIENFESSCTINLVYISNSRDFNIAEKSILTNRFIDKLISKPSAKAEDVKQS